MSGHYPRAPKLSLSRRHVTLPGLKGGFILASGHSKWFICLLLICSFTSGQCAVQVGNGPTFSYNYSTRLALGLDANASHVDVSYVRESPTLFNCSYIVPASSATPASGTVTYQFLPDPGYVIQDVILAQNASLYTTGSVIGEYSINGGTTFQTFIRHLPTWARCAPSTNKAASII